MLCLELLVLVTSGNSQFFDGDDTGLVYTDPVDFSINNQSKPTFSHHKLTCFEYADGVNTSTSV